MTYKSTPEQEKGIEQHERERLERCNKINAAYALKEKAKRYQVSEDDLKKKEEQQKKKKETENWLKADLTRKK
jgi:hypothetical protein